MTAPDHASLPAEELRRLIWRSRYPVESEEAMEYVMMRAYDAAEDAARLVLEGAPLADVVYMDDEQFKYWRRILGGYDDTTPTGVRIGKRWCREMKHGDEVRRWIGEYQAKPGWVDTVWRTVLPPEARKTQSAVKST